MAEIDEHVVQRPTYFRDNELYKKAIKDFIDSSQRTSFQREWDILMYNWNIRSESRAYNCQECKSEWELGPVVIDSLWNAICIASNNNRRTLMCKRCMEAALGRPIAKEEQRELLWNVWRSSAVNE